jgi:peptidoglycan hydrolase-like protein with peptidoglycan-binding domain
MKVILTETQINRLLEQNTDLITTIKQMGFVPSGNAIFKHRRKPELTLTLVGDYIIVKDNGKEIKKIKTSEIEDLEGTIKSTSLKIKSTSLKEQVSPDVKEKVIKIQNKLISLGYNLGKSGADGSWGPLTDKAWKDYTSKKQTNKPSGTKEETLAQKIVGDKNVLNPNASLLFDGDKLYWMVNGTPTKSWNAISGLTWKNTPVKNWGTLLKRFTQSPDEFSKIKDAGPLPKGNYTVGPIETRKGNTSEIGAITALWNKALGKYDNVQQKDTSFKSDSEYSRIGWGNYRAPIIPQTGTVTYGRDNFYIHGGSFEGSHGCIDLTNQMEDFAKYYGTWLASTKKKNIQLVVNYKLSLANTMFTQLWQSVTKTSKEPNRYEKYKSSTPTSFDIGKI